MPCDDVNADTDDGTGDDAAAAGVAHEEDAVLQSTSSLPSATEQAAVEDNPAEEKKASAQIFHITISLRDDWLHRGDALQDMDLQTYAEGGQAHTWCRHAKDVETADLRV